MGAPRVTGRQRYAVPSGTEPVTRRAYGHFLKASLMFSPACLSFEPLWSALPSASRLSSSVALPARSFTLPPSSSDLLSTLSSKAIATSKGYGASTGEIPVVTLGNPDWRRDLARRQR